MSKQGVKVNAPVWQPPTQVAGKDSFTARPFPESRQQQETVSDSEKVTQRPSRSGGMIANINRMIANNPIPAASNVGIEGVQAKLTIGEAGDKYEQEADRVAAAVVQRMNTSLPREEAEDKSIQRKPSIPILMRMPAVMQENNVPGVQADFESQINQARGGGTPLDAAFRAKIEPTMKADFRGVRIHTDAKADQMNQAIQAKAFTTKQDVFFRRGAYQPGNREGQELIAHELTHVVQQNGGRNPANQEKSSNIIQRKIVKLGNGIVALDEEADSRVNDGTETYKVLSNIANSYLLEDDWGELWEYDNDTQTKREYKDEQMSSWTLMIQAHCKADSHLMISEVHPTIQANLLNYLGSSGTTLSYAANGYLIRTNLKFGPWMVGVWWPTLWVAIGGQNALPGPNRLKIAPSSEFAITSFAGEPQPVDHGDVPAFEYRTIEGKLYTPPISSKCGCTKPIGSIREVVKLLNGANSDEEKIKRIMDQYE